MFRDIINGMKIDQVIDPAVITTDTDGASVDMLGYERVTFLALVGESGDTLGSTVRLELEVEESADDSTFTDLADANLQNYVAGTNDGCFGVIDAAAEDDAVFMATAKNTKRYVRPVLNIVGTHSSGIPVGVVAIRHGAQYKPVSN